MHALCMHSASNFRATSRYTTFFLDVLLAYHLEVISHIFIVSNQGVYIILVFLNFTKILPKKKHQKNFRKQSNMKKSLA